MSCYNVPPWQQNIEEHVDHFSNHVTHAICNAHPKKRLGPKKPFLDDEIWNLRANKLRCRSELRDINRRRKLDLLFRVLKAWRPQNAAEVADEIVKSYSITLSCGSVKRAASLHQIAQKLRKKLPNLQCCSNGYSNSLATPMQGRYSRLYTNSKDRQIRKRSRKSHFHYSKSQMVRTVTAAENCVTDGLTSFVTWRAAEGSLITNSGRGG